MKTNFNDLPWHDANLQFIYIDRRKPGEQDIIRLLIDWPDGNSSTIEFYDCYGLIANMNFGILASESILTAECFINSVELDSIRNEWSKIGINLEELKCFKINTNSTNSNIIIFSLGYKILDK